MAKAKQRSSWVDGEASPRIEALGESETFLDFQMQVSRVASVDRPVLLIGERGTGKELAAARIHYLSGRWQKPLVTLNCVALSPGLLESELFGHEAGAFTGANRRREGRFEAATEGSLFLDEIGNIPLTVQEKILRVVEYGSFERVGSSELTQLDVRIIGATNDDLSALARQGRFKADLLDRLSFEVLFLPPLRERKEDIMVLARHFAGRMASEIGMEDAPVFSDEAVEAMEAYSWPGNVRELKNVVERAVYRNQGNSEISGIQFDPFRNPYAPLNEGCSRQEQENADVREVPSAEPPAAEENNVLSSFEFEKKTLKEAVDDLEVSFLKEALIQNRHHQGQAAKLLGLTYNQFRGLYRKHEKRIAQEMAGPMG
ncbi:MAG: phage shock protein operon transcriptional activator [Opitutales bacterium]